MTRHLGWKHPLGADPILKFNIIPSKTGMLHFTVNNIYFELPPLAGEGLHWIGLDKNGLDIQLVFEIPASVVKGLYEKTNMIRTKDDPIIPLNLEIGLSAYNARTGKMEPIGNLCLDPKLKDLENIQLSPEIVQESTLYFPGYAQRAKMESISFGKITNNMIAIEFSGTCTDIEGALKFKVGQIQLPTA